MKEKYMNNRKQKSVQTKKNSKRRGPAPMTFEQFVKSFWSRVKEDPTTGCWIYTGAAKPMGSKSKKTYGVVRFQDGRATSAHRFAYELINGLIPSWLVVSHHRDNGMCVNPTHLHLVTQQINMYEAKLRRRFASGENAPGAKLDKTRVYLMRDLYYSGLLDTSSLETLFEVKNAQPVIRGELWSDVLMPASAEGADHQKLHRQFNASSQRSVSFGICSLIHKLKKDGLLNREIAQRVNLSENRVAIMVRPGTTSFDATNPDKQRELQLNNERIQSWMWQRVLEGKLQQQLVERVCRELTIRYNPNVEGYPCSDEEILSWSTLTPKTKSANSYSGATPKVNILPNCAGGNDQLETVDHK